MYNSLGSSSTASVDERDIVSTVAGPTIIVNPGVDDGKNVANTVDLVWYKEEGEYQKEEEEENKRYDDSIYTFNR
jgi:hypothetical protein